MRISQQDNAHASGAEPISRPTGRPAVVPSNVGPAAASAPVAPLRGSPALVWQGVPIPLAAAGLRGAPPQSSSWTCGLNGAARGLAILGREVADYPGFLGAATPLEFFGIKIGPPPRQLATYTSRLGGSRVWAEAFSDEAAFGSSLRAGWSAGCPSLVLLRAGPVQLHWVLALGRTADNQACVLDSDGRIKKWEGGEIGLRRSCDLSTSLGFQFNVLQTYHIARYNLLRFGPQDVGREADAGQTAPRGFGLGLSAPLPTRR